jgi:cytochrome b
LNAPSGADRAPDRQQADPRSDAKLVWDLPVRVCHWALLVAVLGAYVTHSLGLRWFKVHVWCGYTVLVLVGARIVWGVVGTRHARFASFVRSPATTLRYLWSWRDGTSAHYAGHNPLGAYMVVVLLLLLLGMAVSGLFANDQIANTGPLYSYVSEALSDRLSGWHERLFQLLEIAVGLHVAAVLAHRWLRHEDLIEPMITGKKPSPWLGPGDAINGSRTWLALLIVLLLALGLVWLVAAAPPARFSIF